MLLYKIPGIFKFIYPELIWNGHRNQRVIYLTFDDGPVPGITNLVLDILTEFDIKATFFCVGENIKKNPELFQRIIQEKHMIGNHTYNHINGWEKSVEEYIRNVKRCDELISSQGFKAEVKLFRPPHGKIKKKALKQIGNEFKIVMWDVLSYDFSSKLSKEKSLNKSIQYTRAGTIIIFHDSEKTRTNIEFIIYQYISHFVKKNYQFSTIDRLFLLN